MKKLISLAILALALVVWLTGCASYSHTETEPNGKRNRTVGFSFLKKGDFAALEIGKDGLKIKDAKTGGDVEMLRAGVEGAVSAAIKGAKP